MENSSQSWQQIKDLFGLALDKPASERREFIKQQSVSQAILDEVLLLIDSIETREQAFESIVAKASVQSTQIGKVDMLIDQYRIVSLIGQGGMGEVYLAERADEQYQKQVALKLVSSHRPSEDLVRRFRYERQILASLEHPNIARLIDGGETETGVPYLVMEYIDGMPIDQYCDQNALGTPQRIQLFIKVCEAIQYAHRSLIVHRDVKSSNVLVDSDGKVKLLDFGIAKAIEDKQLSMTQTESRVRSPLHASPEQIRGQNITVASDVYSLGVLFYELLTGVHPILIESTSAAQIEQAICETYPIKPSNRLGKMTLDKELSSISASRSSRQSDLVKQLGGDLDNIVMKALNKEPDRRYATVQDLLDDLARYLDKRPVLARANSISYRVYKFVQRNAAMVLTSSLALTIIVSTSLFSYKRVLVERDVAQTAQRNAETVSEFLQEIFESVEPSVALGETITALDLLEAGNQNISESLAKDPVTAQGMHVILAKAYYAIDDSQKASEQLKLALKVETEQSDDSVLGEIYLLQALVAQDNSQYDIAEELMDKAEKHLSAAFPKPHADMVELIHSKAFLQDTLGKHEEAIVLYEEAIELNKQIDLEQAYAIGWTETRLTDVLRKEGRYEEGIKVLLQVIPSMNEYYDGLHPKLSIAKRQLAMLYKDTNEYEKSEKLYLEIIEEQQKLYSPPSRELGVTFNEYSLLLDKQNDIQSATKYAKMHMAILNELFKGKPNAQYAAAFNNHAYFLKKAGDYKASVDSFKKSIEQQELIGLAPDHFHRSFPMHGLALTYIEMKEYMLAEDLLRQVLPMRLQHMDESHLYVTQVKSSLGDALMRQGKLDEAETFLLDSMKFYSEYQGEDSSEVKVVRGFLEELAEMRLQVN